ncbi:MAG: helix-turn-helix domain-containing protein [Blastocatellales bacterium]
MAKIPDDSQGRTFEDRVVEAFEGASLSEIAAKMGRNYHTLRNWIQQKRDMPPDGLIQIAVLTKTSIHWLLTGEGQKQINSKQEIEFTGADRKVIEEIAASGGITFNETVAHLVREALAHKGIGEMPEEFPVPMFKTIDDEIFRKIEDLPRDQQRAEMTRLIGELMVKVAAQQ